MNGISVNETKWTKGKEKNCAGYEKIGRKRRYPEIKGRKQFKYETGEKKVTMYLKTNT